MFFERTLAARLTFSISSKFYKKPPKRETTRWEVRKRNFILYYLTHLSGLMQWEIFAQAKDLFIYLFIYKLQEVASISMTLFLV